MPRKRLVSVVLSLVLSLICIPFLYACYSGLTLADKIALGAFIENKNPYSYLNPQYPGMTLTPNWESKVDVCTEGYMVWEFEGTLYRVGKSLRIPYTYKDAHGNQIEEYLLIGYTGSAGI